jgi:hypothetical protein
VKRLFAALLAGMTDHAVAQSILGDLEEERGRRRHRSHAGAAVWFWFALAAIASRACIDRLAGRRAERPLEFRSAGAGAFWRPGQWRREIRPALRALRRTPWYAVTVTGVIALSMTLATTVFAVVDGVLFKPLPYPSPSELYGIEGWFSWATERGSSSLNAISRVTSTRGLRPCRTSASAPACSARRRRCRRRHGGRRWSIARFSRSSAFVRVRWIRRLTSRRARRSAGAHQLQALAGAVRWQPSVLGTVVRSHSAPVTGIEIVGVLPRDFVMPGAARIEPEVLPRSARPRAGRGELRGIARLPAPLAAESIRPRLDAAARRLPGSSREPWPAFPRRDAGARAFDEVRLVPFAEHSPTSATAFGIVFALAATLIGLAVVNVAGLTAARTQDRARELSVRRALGQSRRGRARGARRVRAARLRRHRDRRSAGSSALALTVACSLTD